METATHAFPPGMMQQAADYMRAENSSLPGKN